MERLSVLSPDDAGAWAAALRAAGRYDLYHLAAYHALAEERGEGMARLFVYRSGDELIALPLLLRSLSTVPGLRQAGAGLYDASSVYGYPGPISARRDPSPDALAGFREALAGCLRDMGVVSIFSRLNPLIEGQDALLHGLGEVEQRGQTVSIDLRPDPEAQLAAYRQSHRYDLRRLRQRGLVVEHDAEGRYLEQFIAIYHQTMRRVGAAPGYLFNQIYFERLMALDDVFHLLICRAGDTIAAAALFAVCGEIAQYHLAGTDAEFQRLAPMKLVVDEARLWARGRGATVLHLGGGLGAGEDSLFAFKAGFSDRRHRFAIWRWVLAPERYERLNRAREAWISAQRLQAASPEFFPAYRRPTLPAA